MSEVDYRDSRKKLDLKLQEVANNELKGKETVKRELLCQILHIPFSDKRTTEKQILEVLAPICLKNRLTFHDVKHKMLCDYFSIPVYYIPKKKRFLEYRILKLLVEVRPKKLSASEITELLGEEIHVVKNSINNYCKHPNSWFTKSLGKRGKRTVRLWTVSHQGVETFNSGDVKLLFTKSMPCFKRKSPNKSKIRKCAPKVLKILFVLAPADFPLTSRSIADATDMNINHVIDTLKNDKYSISPFFEKIKTDSHRFRYQASKVGIDYYYKHLRVS